MKKEKCKECDGEGLSVEIAYFEGIKPFERECVCEDCNGTGVAHCDEDKFRGDR